MNNICLRTSFLTTAVLAAGTSSAAEYVAKIYAVPGGFEAMFAVGGGDNGMMSGWAITGAQDLAMYRTNGGFRLMHPGGWDSSRITDSWGSTYHCGFGKVGAADPTHALFWIGGGTPVDIHPTSNAGYQSSQALGGGGQLQAGYVDGSFNCNECGFVATRHAGMWSRTSSSFSRLHAPAHELTEATSTDGVRQVGSGVNRTTMQVEALLWSGPNSIAVNLNPPGATESVLTSVWGNSQGGYFQGPMTGGRRHAATWAGGPNVVDLNPNFYFLSSQVNAVRAGLQVGRGNAVTTPARYQAIGWANSDLSWINLHARLPYPFTLWNSSAEGIDNLGNITGYVDNGAGDVRPVIWVRQ
jgi:hypothetical protein